MTMTKMNVRELENVNGGTIGETNVLIFDLAVYGYGKYMRYTGEVDFEGMKHFFASKGFTFIPSKDGQNRFKDRDGITYGQDYIENLIRNELL